LETLKREAAEAPRAVMGESYRVVPTTEDALTLVVTGRRGDRVKIRVRTEREHASTKHLSFANSATGKTLADLGIGRVMDSDNLGWTETISLSEDGVYIVKFTSSTFYYERDESVGSVVGKFRVIETGHIPFTVTITK
jgi:hypothetical protein